MEKRHKKWMRDSGSGREGQEVEKRDRKWKRETKWKRERKKETSRQRKAEGGRGLKGNGLHLSAHRKYS